MFTRTSRLIGLIILFIAIQAAVLPAAAAGLSVPAATTTEITGDWADPSFPGEKVTVQVKVTSAAGTPTGKVAISGAETDCNVWLKNGSAQCDVIFSGTTNRIITAAYLGNASYAPSSDTELHHLIKRKTFYSLAAYDGWTVETTPTSETGGAFNDFAQAFIVGDDSGNRQYRSIIHFDTSSLPDNAEVYYMNLWVKRQKFVGLNPLKSMGSLLGDLKTPYFGQGASLEARDFQATAAKANCCYFGAAFNGWYHAGFAGIVTPINLTGPTQFRLRLAFGDNNNYQEDALYLYSGEAALENQPKLIVQYYIP